MTDVYSLLDEAARAADAGDLTGLDEALDAAERLGFDEPLLLVCFVAALRTRLGGAPAGNLYLSDDETAQIDLFGVLARHLPLLRASLLANDTLLPFLAGRRAATVLALGIGRGGQEVDLLSRAPGLAELTVVGVDVAADSLTAAGTALRAAAERAGAALEYVPVAAATEDLGPEVWRTVAAGPRPLLVTASFALHHMRDAAGGSDSRAALFRRLRELEPAAVALCEPDSDHHRVPLRARVANAWHHYGTLFAAIGATEATEVEKAAMKRFFAREIENVVGAADADRFERHEPVAVWLDRLAAAGFRPLPPAEPRPAPLPDFSATALPDRIELAFKGVPLAAVITAVPA